MSSNNPIVDRFSAFAFSDNGRRSGRLGRRGRGSCRGRGRGRGGWKKMDDTM